MALAHVIMTTLLDGEFTGYDLAKSFDTSLGYFWHVSHQQIYAELKKLREAKSVAATIVPQRSRPEKVVYRLTDKGAKELQEWVYSPSKEKIVKDELLVRLYNLSNFNRPYIVKLISQRRESCVESLTLYRKIKSRNFSDPASFDLRKKGVYLALLGGISEAEWAIDWCDRSLAMLREEE